MKLVRGDYSISTDSTGLDLKVIHGYLTHSYWAQGISEEKVARSVRSSLCFGLYHQKEQVGFVRVLTDYVHTAHLADIFILESHRGRGLGKWLVASVLSHPDLQGLRRWTLATRDVGKRIYPPCGGLCYAPSAGMSISALLSFSEGEFPRPDPAGRPGEKMKCDWRPTPSIGARRD